MNLVDRRYVDDLCTKSCSNASENLNLLHAHSNYENEW